MSNGDVDHFICDVRAHDSHTPRLGDGLEPILSVRPKRRGYTFFIHQVLLNVHTFTNCTHGCCAEVQRVWHSSKDGEEWVCSWLISVCIFPSHHQHEQNRKSNGRTTSTLTRACRSLSTTGQTPLRTRTSRSSLAVWRKRHHTQVMSLNAQLDDMTSNHFASIRGDSAYVSCTCSGNEYTATTFQASDVRSAPRTRMHGMTLRSAAFSS